MITSPHNPRIKLIRSLAGRAKDRREAGLFLAEGARLLEDALETGWEISFALFSSEASARGLKVAERLRAAGVDVEEATPEALKSASETENSQGILAALRLYSLPLPPNPTLILIPDQVRDPGNLGALLRTAAAVGADAVLLPPETTDPYAPKVLRAGMGAHFHIPLASLGWEEIRAHLAGKTTFLADAGGTVSFWDADFRSPCALIVGSEAAGASQNARALAQVTVNIPMPGKIESLNAGVAGAALMLEALRQRNYADGETP